MKLALKNCGKQFQNTACSKKLLQNLMLALLTEAQTRCEAACSSHVLTLKIFPPVPCSLATSNEITSHDHAFRACRSPHADSVYKRVFTSWGSEYMTRLLDSQQDRTCHSYNHIALELDTLTLAQRTVEDASHQAGCV